MKAEQSFPLTDYEVINYLLTQSGGVEMIGKIRAKGACPVCEGKFSEAKKLGFICPNCKTVPTRYYIDLFYQGKRIRLFSDKTGQPLDSYQRSLNILAHINHEIENHIFDPSKYLKAEQSKFYFSTVAEVWIEDKQSDVQQGLKAPSYIKELIAYKDKYFIPFFNATDIREIRRHDIDEFKKQLPEHLSPKTIKNILIALKNMIYTAYRKELIEKMPTFPIVQAPEFSDWKWVDSDTQIRILATIPLQDRAIFAFLFLHGCRPGEARALKIRDIDFKNNTINIRRTFSLGIIRETTKQKKQNIIPIHTEFLPYLSEKAKTAFPESFIFVSKRTEKPYNEKSLRRVWHKALEDAGLKDSGLRLYDASRHSFASQLVNANVPINVISKLLGHSSVKMTARYAHENLDTMRLAMEKITLLLLPSPETVTRPSPEVKAA